uniref:Uncharacterized protein n=1 Tax=Oryza brachyantha TaxID=4533 RepID=J3MRV2_ORYBR
MEINLVNPPATHGDYIQWWKDTRLQVTKEARRKFDGIVVYAAWEIWLHHNVRIFDNNCNNSPRQTADKVFQHLQEFNLS